MNGHIRKRGKKYCVVLYLGRDESGKKKQKWISGFESKKDAQQFLTDKLHDMYHGITVDVSTDTFGKYMCEWLSQKETQVRPSTYRGYEWMVRLHVIPYLGGVKLAELKPQHLQNLYVQLLKQDPPLSKRTVHHLHTMIHQALERGVKWDLIGRNVADAVDPPRPRNIEMQVWNADQVLAFLNSAKDDRYYVVFFLALTTGMRKGEIHGLRWDDIDFDNNRLYIRRSFQWSNGKPYYVEPKTAKSRRPMTLPKTVTAVLRKHKVKQHEEKLRLGSRYEDHDLVVAAPDGRLVNPRVVDQHWYTCRNAAPVPRIRFHDLRHTHATLLLQQGVHPKIVSERLGHSDVTITLNLYSHVLPGMQEKTANDFDEAVFGDSWVL